MICSEPHKRGFIMRTVLLAVLVTSLLISSSGAVEVSDVTIYGKVIMSVDYADNGKDGYAGITSSNSRLGFRGHFILDEKLKAIWQIESKVNFDISGSDFATRNSFVGFTGNFGTLKLGRHDTPYKLTNSRTDAFHNRYGDSRNIIGVYAGDFDRRASRMVMYESPSIYKTGFKLLYKTESGRDGTSLISSSVEYETGGLHLWAAGEIHGKMMTAVNDSTPSEKSEYGLRCSAAWSIDKYSFFGLLESIGDLNGIDGVRKNSWVIGLRYYINEHWNVRTKYVGTGGRSDIEDTAGNMFAADLDWSFSESALFFVAGAITLNDTNAAYNMVNSGLFWTFLPVIGENPWGFSVGTILAF
jgi:predicted porin